MAFPTIQPVTQYFGLDGLPLDAGYIYIGEANADPRVSPINVYWDADGDAVAAQPIRTIAGYPARSGSPAPLFVDQPSYSIRWTDVNGVLIKYIAEVPTPLSSASAFGSQLISAADAEEAREILEVVIGEDVQAYSDQIATQTATEAEMRAGLVTNLRSMSPALVADAIDELGMLVKVSADDTTPGTLTEKLEAGDNITFTVQNNGGDESLLIDANVSGGITKMDQQPMSGETLIEFTGFPPSCVGFNVSWRGVSNFGDPTYVLFQLGTASSYLTSGYAGGNVTFRFATDYDRASATNGIIVGGSTYNMAAGTQRGNMLFQKVNGNVWQASGQTGGNGTSFAFMVGEVDLGDTLTRIKMISDVAFTTGNLSVQYW